MARYIDAEELCRRLTECWHTNDIDKGRLIQSVIDRVITPIVVGIPTADVEEVKHGEWLEFDEKHYDLEFEAPIYRVCYKCSECGRMEWTKEPYCHCGAKMSVTDTNVGSKLKGGEG